MMEERRALGRGLSSLIPIGIRSEVSKVYMECPLGDVVPNINQPRKLFDKSAIDELAASIEEKGILQPLIVRALGGGKYELIAGERRYRAAKQLHLEKVPVIIKDVDANETLELALIENIQRQDLNPVEEALAFKELISKYQYTQDELAKRVGKDRSSIANTLRLLKLPEDVRAYIIAGKITMGHARALLAVEDTQLQQKLADEVIKNDLSVREIENWAKKFKEAEEKAAEKKEKLEVKEVETSISDNHSRYKGLEEALRKALATKVEIKSSGARGKLVIYYSSEDDLNRLFQDLCPDF